MNQNLPEIEPVHTPSLETPPLPFYHTAEGWMARQAAFVLILATVACTVVGHFGFKHQYSPVIYAQLHLIGLMFGLLWLLAFMTLWVRRSFHRLGDFRRIGLFLLLMGHLAFAALSWQKAVSLGAREALEQGREENNYRKHQKPALLPYWNPPTSRH